MRAVVQRVLSASVAVDGRVVGACGRGLLLLVAAHKDDTEGEVRKMAEKVSTLRIFNDSESKMNLALGDLDHQAAPAVLAVSNFTVLGDAAGQRRPSFVEAASFEEGQRLFEAFVGALRRLGHRVETGEFGADMKVELVNDGPVTIILDVPPRKPGLV